MLVYDQEFKWGYLFFIVGKSFLGNMLLPMFSKDQKLTNLLVKENPGFKNGIFYPTIQSKYHQHSTTNFLGSNLSTGFTLIQTRKALDSEQRIIRQSAMPLRQRARHPRFVRLIWVMATSSLVGIGMTKCCVSGSFAGDAKMQPMYLGEEIGRSSSRSCF